MTQNILNPAAVKLGGRIEYLGFLAGRLENTETKSLQQYFKGTFSSFIFTWLELHERVIGSPSWTGWLMLPVTDENRTELCKHKILRKCWILQALIGGLESDICLTKWYDRYNHISLAYNFFSSFYHAITLKHICKEYCFTFLFVVRRTFNSPIKTPGRP